MNEPLEAAAVDCVHKVQGKEDQGNEAHYILGALSSVSKARPWKEGTPLKEVYILYIQLASQHAA
uniref:Uncharacterized protein n=1 Tax=Bionectria ochroleuca TaxID=29856 RepID=A0A0B7JHH2_BIOOC